VNVTKLNALRRLTMKVHGSEKAAEVEEGPEKKG
jgi:hypothetical protein